MAILEIVKHPNEILEQKCERVSVFDKKLGKLLDNMYETMLIHDGVGLAAPQIGLAQQIAVVDVGDRVVTRAAVEGAGVPEDVQFGAPSCYLRIFSLRLRPGFARADGS